MTSKRKEKLVSVEEAAGVIKDGMTIIVGGLLSVNHSMAIIRQIIKNGTKDLTVIGAASTGLEVDLLIWSGCTWVVNSSSLHGAPLIVVGPCVRRAGARGDPAGVGERERQREAGVAGAMDAVRAKVGEAAIAKGRGLKAAERRSPAGPVKPRSR